jgi:hypothetical protein
MRSDPEGNKRGFMFNTTNQASGAFVRSAIRLLVCGLTVSAAAGIAGCGGSSAKAPTTPLPTPPAATKFNTYLGTQGAQASQDFNSSSITQGGVLQSALDDSAGNFTVLNSTRGTIGGTFTAAGDFLDFNMSNSLGNLDTPPVNVNPGYGIEIPGGALLLRAGDYTVAPALLVPISTSATPVCQAIDIQSTFQFVALVDPFNAITSTPVFGAYNAGPAYGVVNIASSGLNYSFTSYNSFYLSGASTSPGSLQSGLCAQTRAGAAITIPPDTANNVPPITMEIGPTGVFVMDQTQANPDGSTGLSAGVGVIAPSSPLSVSSIIAANYAGFKFEPALEQNNDPGANLIGCPLTELVGFGATAGSGTSLVGGTLGTYPEYACASYPIAGLVEDPTAAPASDTSITLGTQAANNNGLFQSASVTVPDPNGVCAANGVGTVGMSANGSVTCTFPAAAVAGNPGGKFALFVVANNFVDQSPMGIYLFEQ